MLKPKFRALTVAGNSLAYERAQKTIARRMLRREVPKLIAEDAFVLAWNTINARLAGEPELHTRFASIRPFRVYAAALRTLHLETLTNATELSR